MHLNKQASAKKSIFAKLAARKSLFAKNAKKSLPPRNTSSAVLSSQSSVQLLDADTDDASRESVVSDGQNVGVSRKAKIAKQIDEQESLANKRGHQMISYLVKKTHFTTDEVRALIEIYKKINSSGKMDRLRFREMLHGTLGLTDDIMLDRVFSVFDGDNQGNVSDSEWITGLSIMLRGNLEEQIAFCYEVYDINGDRSIGREELAACLRGCLYPIPGKHGEMSDHADLEEGQREIVELALRKLDVDRDGQIKFTDFQKAVNSDPTLLQCIGQCLPTDSAMMTFLALFSASTQNRSFSTFLAHPMDPAWKNEKDKFNPNHLHMQKHKQHSGAQARFK